MNQVHTRRLVESSLLIAMTVILYIIKIFPLPYGGAVTFCSMLPLLILSYRYGVKWGIFSGLVGGLLLMMVDASGGIFKGATFFATIGSVVLDYLVAFSVLGLAGAFRKRTCKTSTDLICATVVCGFLRLAIHFISGFIFFGSYAEWFFSQDGFTLGTQILRHYSGIVLSALYSIIYNSMFMIPEIILTSIMAGILGTALNGYLSTPQQNKS